MSVTYDINDFGYVEVEEAENLMREYRNSDKDGGLGSGVKIAFNTMSGYVFLTDEDYNVAMLNDDSELEKWVYCGNCGHEDFLSEFENPNYLEEDEDGEEDDIEFKCPECGEDVC